MSCGAQLAARCPSCGAESPPGAKFCIECGTPLSGAGAAAKAAPPSAPSAPPQAPAQPGGQGARLFGGRISAETGGWGPGSSSLPEERRKATVLFADLSGYTAVAERLDPEAVKSFVDRALRRLGQEVVRYGGTVDKYIGDNVMAVFGAPVAHEDDPERAVRAGLAMQAAMEEINTDIEAATGSRFSLRVGINSGEVLAGQVGDGYTVIGDVVNVASRLQSAARPGSVTVGRTTHRLTRGPIEYEELEPLTLKGKSEPVPAWEAVRLLVSGHRGSRHADRCSAHRPRGRVLTPRFALRPRRARGAPEPGHGDRPGRGRKDATAAGVRHAARGPRATGRLPGRALPGLWRRAGVLGARRDHPRPVRDRRHRRLSAGVGQVAPRNRGERRQARHRRARRAHRGHHRPAARDRTPRRCRERNDRGARR